MKLLREFISLLLIESRISDVQAKYPELDIEVLISLDPTNNNKYLVWIAKQVDKGHTVEDIAPTVSYFHNNNQRFAKKDINAYEDLKDLENEVKRLSQLKTSKEKKVEAKAGAEIIYNDEEVAVRYVGSKAACQQYGQGTKWCITMKDASYFEQYTSANTVFYYIFRNEPLSDNFDKVAAAVKRDKNNNIKEIQYFDASDRSYETLKFNNSNEIVTAIKQHASTIPKGNLAKLLDGELKGKEVIDTLDLYRGEKDALVQISAEFYKIKDPETLAMLAEDENWHVRVNVARNSSMPPEILQVLAEDENQYVRRAIANNLLTPPEVLLALVEDENWHVRVNVADNSSSPAEALQVLAEDENVNIRRSVAENPSTKSEVLQVMAGDEFSNVRLAVIGNRSAPPEVLLALAEDENEYVRGSVARNPSTLPETLQVLAEDEIVGVRLAVARNSAAPPEVLQALAKDKYRDVRVSVANHPSTPIKVLQILSKDKSSRVRRVVAENPSTSSETLAMLAKHKNNHVKLSVVFNPSTSLKTLQMLTKNKDVQQFAQEQLDKRG